MDELIRRAEQELADGDPAARTTIERAHIELLEQRDAEGLERLLDLAGRLEDGGDLTKAIRTNLRWLRGPHTKHNRWYIAIAVAAPTLVAVLLTVWWWRAVTDPANFQSSVNATATFEESADCIRYWRSAYGWRIDDYLAYCFPTQTAAKKEALVACFNTYEREHPDHDGWPEDNMRGCTWDGLVAVSARNVTSLVFGRVEALPAVPRAGERFVLLVGLTRTESAAKVVHTEIDDDDVAGLDVAMTIDGENVAINPLFEPSFTEPGYWFEEGKLRLRFTVPKTAEGKRLAIKITAEADTTVTKVVAFTVGP
jgi:hypothetical protein